MRVIYIDAFSGASGDMLLGALVDLGISPTSIQQVLSSLPLGPWSMEVSRQSRHHIHGTRVLVKVPLQEHHHRTHAQIKAMLLQADLPPWVRQASLGAFERLARAEAHIHDMEPDQVTFHEVGAVDSIVDIVGSMLGFHLLGADRVVVSPLPLGRGFADGHHGRLPVPAPATLELLQNVPVYEGESQTELVTPTAAAILTEVAQQFGPLPPMRVERLGYGVGSRDLPERPNLLRLILGQQEGFGIREDWVLEANIDDMNPEFCEHLMERLLAEGAMDVGWCPMIMKRGRPGGLLRVLAKAERKDALTQIILQESTSIGVRTYQVRRQCLDRHAQPVETPWGTVRIKVSSWGGQVLNALPEYQDCRDIALRTGVSLKEVYFRALAAYHSRGQSGS